MKKRSLPEEGLSTTIEFLFSTLCNDTLQTISYNVTNVTKQVSPVDEVCNTKHERRLWLIKIFIMKDSKDTKRLILFNALLRWAFGIVFISLGVVYYEDGAWPVILFGTILFITGFFRPKRCLDKRC